MRTSCSEETSVALVVGASGGIGLALADELLARRPQVHLVAACRAPQSSEALQAIEQQHRGRVTLLAMDVCDEDSVARAAGRLDVHAGQLDLLLNCVGVLHDEALQPERRLSEIEPAKIMRSFEVNALGALIIAKHFARLFDRESRSVLANLSARVGSIGDNRLGGWYAYRAAKAAQNMFTRNLAIELAHQHRGLICVALHPGTVDTKLSQPFQARVPPQQLFSTASAAEQLLSVVDGLDRDDNGSFFAWDGTTIPW